MNDNNFDSYLSSLAHIFLEFKAYLKKKVLYKNLLKYFYYLV